MTDLKYFSTNKKGEIFELKAELLSDKKDKKREAIKKIIANMTVGKDVSALFPDVVNCMQTDNLELKKLVYLYLMNYAKTQPDLAILAVNTFVKDCEDPNPLIRALAVRTMGCIRVDKISEYLCIPLRQCLKDEDPYVRKTAAVCVAKLYDINPALVNEQGFIQTLVSMISDSNPMVVSNAVAALSEIAASRPSAKIFDLDSATTNKLLTALNECSEWGQVFLMDAIATYVPREEREALSICERVTSRLAHANAAVVLSAVKVLMLLMERMDPNSDFVKELEKKLAPPLVTLLSAEPEIQYVALRNINIILQRRPNILKNELRVFFVKYNDPIYVKLEKLDIMIRLTNSSNINQVLSELKEYATEVDVEFVCKAVRAIGRCAIKVEEFAERCISSLLDLVKTKINYVVQESVVVIKDIFRKYPNRYEAIISTLCENLATLDEPEARASMIWIIGEYADRIENSTEILSGFLDGFAEETNQQVQLQLLTAIVKAFLKKPLESQNIVTRVLQLASEECENPDVRDRGYIYWRLLSTDSQAARDIVLAEKPKIGEETDNLEPEFLTELISYIGTLMSVFQKPQGAFLEPVRSQARSLIKEIRTRPNEVPSQALDSHVDTTLMGQRETPNLLDIDTFEDGEGIVDRSRSVGDSIDVDLKSILGPSSTTPVLGVERQEDASLVDLFGLLSTGENETKSPQIVQPSLCVGPRKVWLRPEDAKGLKIDGFFALDSDRNIIMDMTFSNRSMDAAPLTNFAMQLNRNPFRLCPAAPLAPLSLQAGQSYNVQVKLARSGQVNVMPTPLLQIQAAIKNNIGIFYFAVEMPLVVLLSEAGAIAGTEYISTWRSLPDDVEHVYRLECPVEVSTDTIIERLKTHCIFTVSRQQIDDNEMLYQSMKLIPASEPLFALVEIRRQNKAALSVAIKCNNSELTEAVHQTYEDIVKAVK